MSNSVNLPDIAPELLKWYDAQARALPWRNKPTPYRVWVSEIMLQQTRVEAVKPYFARFIAALPDIESLAKAPEELLFKLWEGLGYYARARNLQKAAQTVMREYGGRLPDTPEGLRTLPGIGPYTAGAVASIAFGRACPAVDGNVLRVVARLLASPENIADPAVRGRFAALLRDRLGGRPGDFNQALMELGALVCLPRNPKCPLCPLSTLCRAYSQGTQSAFPVHPPRAARTIVPRTVLVLRWGELLALRRRNASGLLAGLWELPAVEGHLSPDEALGAVRAMGLAPLGIAPLANARHVFTHLEWDMRGYRIDVRAPEDADGLVWATRAQLKERYALPRAFAAYMDAWPERV